MIDDGARNLKDDQLPGVARPTTRTTDGQRESLAYSGSKHRFGGQCYSGDRTPLAAHQGQPNLQAVLQQEVLREDRTDILIDRMTIVDPRVNGEAVF